MGGRLIDTKIRKWIPIVHGSPFTQYRGIRPFGGFWWFQMVSGGFWRTGTGSGQL